MSSLHQQETKKGNCGQVTKTYGGLKEDKNYFNKICLTDISWLWLPFSGDKNANFIKLSCFSLLNLVYKHLAWATSLGLHFFFTGIPMYV